MMERPPTALAAIKTNRAQLGVGAQFLSEMMGRHFSWEDVRYTAPTRTFSGRLDLKVGDKDVQLIYAGPAHTKGDTLVWLPKDKTVFAGDLMFVGGHPVIWAGPVGNWIRACDMILGWDVDIVVPGHGPITDKKGVAHFKSYLQYISAETRKLSHGNRIRVLLRGYQLRFARHLGHDSESGKSPARDRGRLPCVAHGQTAIPSRNSRSSRSSRS